MTPVQGLPFVPVRALFFTGKGGVGKTSLACATAVRLAASGRRVLLVSTDPASNLDEVLDVLIGTSPTPVPGARGLDAVNIDPEAAARAYREQLVGPYRDVLPSGAVARIEEELSGACTTEIAAFDQFVRLLADEDQSAGYAHVVFDTAPTGHTLRLLKLPAAWDHFLETNTTGTSCLGPLSGLRDRQVLYRRSLDMLSDPSSSLVVLVARPDEGSLREAERTRSELASVGMANQVLGLNGIFTATDRSDPLARALAARGQAALGALPAGLAALPRFSVPLLPWAPLGVERLQAVFDAIPDTASTRRPALRGSTPAPLGCPRSWTSSRRRAGASS